MVEKRKDFIINTVYFAIIALIGVYAFKFAFSYLTPFIFGFLIAFVLKPVVVKLNTIFGEKKVLSIIVTVLFYIVVGSLLVWLFLKGVNAIAAFAESFPAFYSSTIHPVVISFLEWLEGVVESLDPAISDQIMPIVDSAIASVTAFLPRFATTMASKITQLVTSVPSLLISVLIAIISSFFFSSDYRTIVNGLLIVLPAKAQRLVVDIKDGVLSVLVKYLRAYAILMSVTFVELSIVFLLLGMSNPFGLAFMIAIVDILPVLGTGSVMIPWAIIEITVGNRELGFILAIVYVVITVIRNILEPKVVGKQIGLHPLLTLVCIYVGLKLFGFIGLLGLPITATLLKTLHEEGKINFFGKLGSKKEVPEQGLITEVK